MQTQAIISRLLTNLGSQQEVEQYLKHYANGGQGKFAIVFAGGEMLQADMESLSSSLAFLAQVGLKPIVVHGVGPQLDEALASDVGGEKGPTTAKVLDVSRRLCHRENHRLVKALEGLGTRARPLIGGVFTAEAQEEQRLCGKILHVEADTIDWSLEADYLPVISPLGESNSGQILSLDPRQAVFALAKALRPHKVILLNHQDGLVDTLGRKLSAVNISEDFDTLYHKETTPVENQDLLKSLKRLLEQLPEQCSVSIVSPGNLAKELFTHKGAGTLVRLGESILVHQDFSKVDLPRLHGLLETCFHKKLVDNYFEERELAKLYLSQSYRATAIVVKMGGIPYLDKFAVTAAAQGAGVGGSLWRRMKKEHPQLFWRAKVKNPINPWYFKNAQGSYRRGDWVVFWYGLDSFSEAQYCIERALSLPATFQEAS